MTVSVFDPDVESVLKLFNTEFKKNTPPPWLRHAKFFAKATTITAITGVALMAGGSSSAKADVVFTEITGEDNPFNGTDVGYLSTPAFADIDGDGDDYTAVSGTLTWADGDTADKTFTVSISDDTEVEGDETIVLELSNPTGLSVLGANASAVLTVIDDDISDSGSSGGDTSDSGSSGGGCFIETAKTDTGWLKAFGRKLRSVFTFIDFVF